MISFLIIIIIILTVILSLYRQMYSLQKADTLHISDPQRTATPVIINI